MGGQQSKCRRPVISVCVGTARRPSPQRWECRLVFGRLNRPGGRRVAPPYNDPGRRFRCRPVEPACRAGQPTDAGGAGRRPWCPPANSPLLGAPMPNDDRGTAADGKQLACSRRGPENFHQRGTHTNTLAFTVRQGVVATSVPDERRRAEFSHTEELHT